MGKALCWMCQKMVQHTFAVPVAVWTFLTFGYENSISTVKHLADHTSPSLLELSFYLFLRSGSGKLLYLKWVTTELYLCPHTIHLMSAQLPRQASLCTPIRFHPSILFSVAFSDLLPIIISHPSKARQSLLSQSTLLFFTITCVKIRSHIFSPPF